MKNKTVETHLRAAVANTVPDVLNNILSECEDRKGKVIEMKAKTSNKNWVRPLCATAAAMALLVGGVFGAGHIKAHAVDSVVSLDVNPSIEIEANKNEIVVSVKGLNEDGIKIIDKEKAEGTKLEGAKLDELTKELVASMVEEGYLTELANSVLVSVDNEDTEKGTEIEKSLMDAINSALSENGVDGAVIGQKLSKDGELKAIADKLGISVGKAGLISSIVENQPELSFEDLANMSINDLSLIAKQIEGSSAEIKIVGSPSDKNYVSAKCAIENACVNANVAVSDIVGADAKIGYTDGKLVYSVKVKVGETELNYNVDAKSGEIISIVSAVVDAATGKAGNTTGGTTSGGNTTGSSTSGTTVNPKYEEAVKDIITDTVGEVVNKVLPGNTTGNTTANAGASDNKGKVDYEDEITNAVKDTVGKVVDKVTSENAPTADSSAAKTDYEKIITDIVTEGTQSFANDFLGGGFKG